jgi:membrane protease YdiL (CAAX protease family)
MPTHRKTWPFFLLALGLTSALQLPTVLAQRGLVAGPAERFLPLVALGALGPVIAALVAARLEGTSARELLLRPRAPWASWAWYAAAPALFPALHLAGMALYALAGGRVDRWLYAPEHGAHLAALVLFPLAEEPGWRGFALPRLRDRHGPLAASLMVGAAWAAWHTMMFLSAGLGPALFALSLLNILFGSVIFTWVYERTQGSLAVAVLLHVGAHLDNPAHALPDHPLPFAVHTAALGVAAAALTPGMLRGARRGGQPA